MEIEKTLALPAPPQQVWALLLDPQAMGACVPGMESIEVLSPDEYVAVMRVKLSFISARFKLRTRIVELREPHLLVAEGTGEDAAVASSLKQRTEMQLEPRGEQACDLRLKVQVDLLGRMGTFGLAAMKTKADRLWEEFGVNLAARLGAQAATAAPAPAPAAALPELVTSEPAVPAAVTSAPTSNGARAPTVTGAAPVPSTPGWWLRLLRAVGIQPAQATGTIVVELRRPDQTLIRIEWPENLAAECAQWLREAAR